MVRRSRSPLLSINVTSLRSTVHPRPFCARCLFFQHVLSSLTHGSTKRPSRVHLCSVAVSAIVIRSIRVARFLRPVASALRPPTGLTIQFKRHPFTKGEWFANARAAIGNLLVRSGFASRASRTTHAQAECIAGAKARRNPKLAELIDLYWDGGPKARSLDRAARFGSAAFVVGCPFCGTRKKCRARESVSQSSGIRVAMRFG